MSLQIGWFSFDGPFETTSELKRESGVFAVLAEIDGRYDMLDIDEGEDLRKAAEEHERRSCWTEHAGGPLRYVVYYLPADTPEAREKIVREVRMQYKMTCSPDATPDRGFWRPEDQ